MISRVKGTILERHPDRVEVETASGLVYEVEVPLSVMERLPPAGAAVELRTAHVVREDAVLLCGFLTGEERELFLRLLGASGVGTRLALAMLSAFPAGRLALALVEHDLAALTQVSGVGKKTAQKLALELSDKVSEFARAVDSGGGTGSRSSQEAVQALVALGYTFQDADRSVRRVLNGDESMSTDELIRRALAGE